jgi:hypothetical protein
MLAVLPSVTCGSTFPRAHSQNIWKRKQPPFLCLYAAMVLLARRITAAEGRAIDPL